MQNISNALTSLSRKTHLPLCQWHIRLSQKAPGKSQDGHDGDETIRMSKVTGKGLLSVQQNI